MVNRQHTLEIFDKHFLVDGGYREYNSRTQAVDVEGDLYVKSHIKYLPQFPVQIGHVSGNVRIKDVGLQSLMLGPAHVRGMLNLDNNDLTSLAHAPHYVGQDFMVENNKLTTFAAPHTHVQHDLIARGNKLENINGCPKVDGSLVITRNAETLEDLSGLGSCAHKFQL